MLVSPPILQLPAQHAGMTAGVVTVVAAVVAAVVVKAAANAAKPHRPIAHKALPTQDSAFFMPRPAARP